jgi:hypothetical protein
MATVTDATVKTWFQAHERLLIVFMILAVGTFGIQRLFDHAATVDSAKSATEQAVLIQQVNTNTQLASQTATQVQQYQAMVTQLVQQNASLIAAIASDNSNLAKQQATDKTLTPTQLTQRWSVLVPNVTPTVTPNGVSVTTQEAQATVSMLENVPVLQQNLKDETAIADNTAKELNDSNVVNADQAKQITGLNAQIVDADKASKAEVKAVKAEARKSKLRYFFAGVIAGFVGRGAI